MHTSNEQRACLYIECKGVCVRMCVLAPTDPVWLMLTSSRALNPAWCKKVTALTQNRTDPTHTEQLKGHPEQVIADIQHNQSSLTLKQIIPKS